MSLLYSIISSRARSGAGQIPAPPSGFTNPFFMIGGESQMGGIAPNSDASGPELAVRSQVKIFNNNSSVFQSMQLGVNSLLSHAGLCPGSYCDTHSIENQIANRVVAGAFDVSTIHLLKMAQGGTKIINWKTGNTDYLSTNCRQIFTDRYNAAKAIDSTLEPILIWSLAVNDYIAGTNITTFKNDTIDFFDYARTLCGSSMPIIFGKVDPTLTAFNNAIEEIVDQFSDCYFIESTGVTFIDGIHFDYTSQKLMADRYVDKILEHYTI